MVEPLDILVVVVQSRPLDIRPNLDCRASLRRTFLIRLALLLENGGKNRRYRARLQGRVHSGVFRADLLPAERAENADGGRQGNRLKQRSRTTRRGWMVGARQRRPVKFLWGGDYWCRIARRRAMDPSRGTPLTADDASGSSTVTRKGQAQSWCWRCSLSVALALEQASMQRNLVWLIARRRQEIVSKLPKRLSHLV